MDLNCFKGTNNNLKRLKKNIINVNLFKDKKKNKYNSFKYSKIYLRKLKLQIIYYKLKQNYIFLSKNI